MKRRGFIGIPCPAVREEGPDRAPSLLLILMSLDHVSVFPVCHAKGLGRVSQPSQGRRSKHDTQTGACHCISLYLLGHTFM